MRDSCGFTSMPVLVVVINVFCEGNTLSVAQLSIIRFWITPFVLDDVCCLLVNERSLNLSPSCSRKTRLDRFCSALIVTILQSWCTTPLFDGYGYRQ